MFSISISLCNHPILFKPRCSTESQQWEPFSQKSRMASAKGEERFWPLGGPDSTRKGILAMKRAVFLSFKSIKKDLDRVRIMVYL